MYEGTLVRLRELRPADAEICKSWVNSLDVARNIYGGGPMPLTVENERDFLNRVTGRQNNSNHFAMETLSGEFIGVTSYTEADWTSRHCMIGWFIGEEKHRGKGYGTDMIKILLKICFHELDMHKVSLHVFAYNEPAIRLYERLGFVKEGAYRENVFAMGRRWDELRYSMLRDEYEAIYGGEN